MYAYIIILGILVGACHGLVSIALSLDYSSLSLSQYIVLGVSVILLAVVEGYMGFHKSWAPTTVHRCLLLPQGLVPDFTSFVVGILAPVFAAGLIFASKRRLVISYILPPVIVALVFGVHSLPHPWREVIDAAVAVGISLGTLSYIYHMLRAIVSGQLPLSEDVFLTGYESLILHS